MSAYSLMIIVKGDPGCDLLQAMEGRVRAAKVNCDVHQKLCQGAAIGAYPSVRFYRGAASKHSPQV